MIFIDVLKSIFSPATTGVTNRQEFVRITFTYLLFNCDFDIHNHEVKLFGSLSGLAAMTFVLLTVSFFLIFVFKFFSKILIVC